MKLQNLLGFVTFLNCQFVKICWSYQKNVGLSRSFLQIHRLIPTKCYHKHFPMSFTSEFLTFPYISYFIIVGKRHKMVLSNSETNFVLTTYEYMITMLRSRIWTHCMHQLVVQLFSLASCNIEWYNFFSISLKFN